MNRAMADAVDADFMDHPGVRAMTDPTDADIVALMKLRGNGTREQPRTELGTPVGIAWRGVGILEQDAQAAWDRYHAQPAR